MKGPDTHASEGLDSAAQVWVFERNAIYNRYVFGRGYCLSFLGWTGFLLPGPCRVDLEWLRCY